LNIFNELILVQSLLNLYIGIISGKVKNVNDVVITHLKNVMVKREVHKSHLKYKENNLIKLTKQ